jgi:predicted Zn finger-like uncharacterized protein/prepilin-type processing-associated H-X9-DG protein
VRRVSVTLTAVSDPETPPPITDPPTAPRIDGARTQCPHCGFAYTVAPEQAVALAGRSFACTNCGQPFALSPSGAAFAQPAQQVAYASGAHVRSNPLAIASLICGCLLCVPFVPGIASIITGAIGMRKTRDPAVTGRGMAIAGLVLGILNVLLWGAYFGLIFAIMVPTMGMARNTANQVNCASNLRTINIALFSYAAQNNGALPDTLEELLALPGSGVTSAVFNCPVTPTTPPATNSPQALAGLVEYVYVGKGLTTHAPPTTVLAYEPMANHGTGSNMLFADGTVTFVSAGQARQMIAEIEAGQNPPPSGGGASGPNLPPPPPTAPALEVEQ